MKFKLTSNIYCTVRSNEIFSTHACCFCPIPLDACSTIKTGARCTEVEVQTTVYTSKTSSTVTSCHSSISFIACTTVKACVNVTELKINVTTCAIKSFSTNTACCWIFLHTCPTIITSVQPTVWRVCFTQQSSEASGTITQLSLFLFLQCKCHHSCRLLVCRSCMRSVEQFETFSTHTHIHVVLLHIMITGDFHVVYIYHHSLISPILILLLSYLLPNK